MFLNVLNKIHLVFFLFFIYMFFSFFIRFESLAEDISFNQKDSKYYNSIQTIFVENHEDLKRQLSKLKAGTRLVIKSGLYTKGIYLKNVHGAPDAPIFIEGDNLKKPPVFMGQGEGIKLSSCSYIKFSNLSFQGFTKNGINIDDSGNLEATSHHIVLDNIHVLDIGPTGNNDALKLSGVDHFLIRNLEVKGWGGSAVDMVGCHNGIIENSRFIGLDGYRTANGIQIKGGSRSILVQNSFFDNAGQRVIQIGGLTGKQYFRPLGTNYEAKDVIIAGNIIVGGEAQIAWVSAQESHVFNNLFYLPGKWLGRILQETQNPIFEPTQNGFFERNVVVTDSRVRSIFNVGRGTKPSSFVFQTNVWFDPQGSIKPNLPTIEIDGIHNIDPMLIKNDHGSFDSTSTDPRIKNVGPWSYSPRKSEDFKDIFFDKLITPKAQPSEKSTSSLLLVVSLPLVGISCLCYLGYRALRPGRSYRS